MIEISRKHLEEYLSAYYGKPVRVTGIKKLGKGFHSHAFLLECLISGRRKRLVLKGLDPEAFGHDYPSDRAQALILANMYGSLLPKSVKVLDVAGITGKKDFIPIGKCRDFAIIMEEATGIPHFQNFDRIMKTGRLTELDKQRELALSDYLVKIHSKKNTNPHLYKRKLRDTIGHGECLMGVIDTYPEKITFTSYGELGKLVQAAIPWWIKLRSKQKRLCEIHGDFYPGNIWFKKGTEFELLDRSRGPLGDAADDVAAYTINLIFYSLWRDGSWKGVFREMFELFFNNYIKKTKDQEIAKVIAPFFAFRSVVVAHPLFYPEPPDGVRRKILNFAFNILENEEFDPEKVDEYIKPHK